jgi:uncharacterized protein
MTGDQMTGLILALIVMFIGLIGTVIPGIPGSPLILIAAVVHRLYFGEQSVSYLVLGLLVLLSLLSLLLDFLDSMYGAKKLGATWKGITGAIVGAIVGIFFSLPGIILGPFIGAVLFELIGGREWGHSMKAGLGAMLGLVIGALGKLACCAAMIGLFSYSVYTNSGINRPGMAGMKTTATESEIAEQKRAGVKSVSD